MVSVETFSEMVRGIYAAAVEPDAWSAALENISRSAGGGTCALTINGYDGNVITLGAAHVDPAAMAAYNDYYGSIDPVAAMLQSLPAGAVVTQRNLLPPDTVASSEFFNDWAFPNGFGDCLFSVVDRHADRFWWMWLSAPYGARPDASRSVDAELLRALLPHLKQAVGIHARMGDLERHRGGLAAAIDGLRHGVVYIDADGRVAHLNPVARALIGRGDGLMVRAQTLRAATPDADAAVAHAVKQAVVEDHRTPAGSCVAVPRSACSRPYLVRVVPLTADSTGFGAPGGAVAVVVDTEERPTPQWEALVTLYGLTRAEALVALHVLEGTGLGPIAEELSVSLSTVRTHLRHIFEKTGTHRQAELVRLLLSGLDVTRTAASHPFG